MNYITQREIKYNNHIIPKGTIITGTYTPDENIVFKTADGDIFTDTYLIYNPLWFLPEEKKWSPVNGEKVYALVCGEWTKCVFVGNYFEHEEGVMLVVDLKYNIPYFTKDVCMDVDGVVKKTEGITGTGTISKTIYESPFIQNICSGEEFFEVRPKTKISLSQMGEIASLVNKFDKENSEKSEHEEPEAVRFAKWVKDKTIPIGLNSEYVFVCDLNYKNAKRYTIEELYKLFKEQEK